MVEFDKDNTYMIERDEQGRCKLFRKLHKDEKTRPDQEVVCDDMAAGDRWLFLFEAADYKVLEDCITSYRVISLNMNKILKVLAEGGGNVRC